MRPLPAPAKINLALVVGPRRPDGLHDVATVLQRVDICDRIELESAPALSVEGFRDDTLVRSGLERLAEDAGAAPAWRVRIAKSIPVAGGLGGGSSDAATALRLANETLPTPLSAQRLAALAFGLGADVPFFLEPGPQLAEGAGERLTPLELPQDYWVLVALPRWLAKGTTAAVYQRFDELGGGPGFDERRRTLLEALAAVRRPRDFGAFPLNDLALAGGGRELADELRAAGAFRADVSGAGPAVYGLFHRLEQARAATRAVRRRAATWIAPPVW
jgi:4-diphosphocytidyl-2-C-methyl-D-erythritol kinase